MFWNISVYSGSVLPCRTFCIRILEATVIFLGDPCLLWPNGWMDEDATWYGSRPRPRPHSTHIVLDGVPALRETGTAAPPLFSVHVYCGHGGPSQLLLSSFTYARFCLMCFIQTTISALHYALLYLFITCSPHLYTIGANEWWWWWISRNFSRPQPLYLTF